MAKNTASKLANRNDCYVCPSIVWRRFPSRFEVKNTGGASLHAKMPRSRKREKEDHSDSGRDEAVQEEKDESPDETSSVKKKKKILKSVTFKIEHW